VIVIVNDWLDISLLYNVWYNNHSPLLYLLVYLASCLACIAFSCCCGLVFSLVPNCLGGLHSLIKLVLELHRHLFY